MVGTSLPTSNARALSCDTLLPTLLPNRAFAGCGKRSTANTRPSICRELRGFAVYTHSVRQYRSDSKSGAAQAVEGSTPLPSALEGCPSTPVLAGNDLNTYSKKDYADTSENGKDQAGTSSAAFSASTAPHLAPPSEASQDASLQVLMSAWPYLGPDAKRKIMAIIRTEDEKLRGRQDALGN